MQHDVVHNIYFQWRPLQNSTEIDIAHLSPLSFHPMKSQKRCVCVVIPTKKYRENLFKRWLLFPEVKKVVVLYNGPPLTRRENLLPDIEIIHCVWEGHGQTRNKALTNLDTDFTFFTVDDALPLSSTLCPLIDFLSLKSSIDIDAVVARQCPYPNAGIYVRQRLLKYMPAHSQPALFHQCDNVGTLYRTPVLLQTPFPDVDIAEDYLWAIGKKIYYHPNSCILHSHQRHPISLYRREYSIYGQLKEHLAINHPFEDLYFSMKQTYRYGMWEGINTFFEKLGSHIGNQFNNRY